MDHLKENILNCLKNLKGSGKFLSVHTSAFQFPGLEVNGVGEIAYPINETQAKALIQAAQKAPFAKRRRNFRGQCRKKYQRNRCQSINL